MKGVLVEKPFSSSIQEAEEFIDYCRLKEIKVFSCYPRRFDETMNRLKDCEISKMVGQPMVVFATYGNGLENNGSHLINMIEFLLGEIKYIQVTNFKSAFVEGPIKNDLNIGFNCTLTSGVSVSISPIRFNEYREVGVDIWGSLGRLQILHEGLTIIHTSRVKSRTLADAYELEHDQSKIIKTTIGSALYKVYDNLSAALVDNNILSTGADAVRVMKIINLIKKSYAQDQSQPVLVE